MEKKNWESMGIEQAWELTQDITTIDNGIDLESEAGKEYKIGGATVTDVTYTYDYTYNSDLQMYEHDERIPVSSDTDVWEQIPDSIELTVDEETHTYYLSDEEIEKFVEKRDEYYKDEMRDDLKDMSKKELFKMFRSDVDLCEVQIDDCLTYQGFPDYFDLNLCVTMRWEYEKTYENDDDETVYVVDGKEYTEDELVKTECNEIVIDEMDEDGASDGNIITLNDKIEEIQKYTSKIKSLNWVYIANGCDCEAYEDDEEIYLSSDTYMTVEAIRYKYEKQAEIYMDAKDAVEEAGIDYKREETDEYCVNIGNIFVTEAGEKQLHSDYTVQGSDGGVAVFNDSDVIRVNKIIAEDILKNATVTLYKDEE